MTNKPNKKKDPLLLQLQVNQQGMPAPGLPPPGTTDEEAQKNSRALFVAVQQSDRAKVLSLLEKPVDLNWINQEENQSTALHAAVSEGDAILVALLLGKGARIDIRDKDGKTPLNLSLGTVQNEITELLANRALSLLERFEKEEEYRKKGPEVKWANKKPLYEFLSRSLGEDLEEGKMKDMRTKIENINQKMSALSLPPSHPPAPTTIALALVETDALGNETEEVPKDEINAENEQPSLSNRKKKKKAILHTQSADSSKSALSVSSDSTVSSLPRQLFEKHLPRNSFMSELLQISHFQTIYNIFVAILVVVFISTLLSNRIETGEFIDFSLLLQSFARFPFALSIWVACFFYSFIVVGIQHALVHKMAPAALLWGLYFLSIGVLYCVPATVVLHARFPVATGFFIMCEIVRFSMKMHSFMATNRALQEAKKNGVNDSMVQHYPDNISIQNYFYFLWAPTVVYQPVYPRTEKIRPEYVIIHFTEFFFAVIYTYVIFKRYCIPMMAHMNVSTEQLVQTIFSLMLPATISFLLGFFAILHSWLNAFAELTRFADRHFYRDWWNATNWAEYYRKWNVVVHNFLYYHIFKESLHWGFNKNLALLFTFFVSAVVHEYIVACALGFYNPILLLMFGGPGVFFIYLTGQFAGSRLSNVFMWMMLFIGNGMLLGLYSRAWNIHNSHIIPGEPFSWSKFWGFYN